jgi:lipid II:glycine glycyltransferase (peptidoglycan interpeptide bridge formation enzyme)
MKEQTKGMEEQMRPMRRQMAQQFVKSWKINKALYQKYGGRVIFQQAGVEPLDAYRDFLREQEEKGAFQILDKQYEAGFWRYFTNDAMHTFYEKEDGAKFINTPWWMMDEPPEE